MGSRSASLRTKAVAPLVSLAALWAFAAWVTPRDGLTALGVQTLDAQVAEPSESLRTELRQARRMPVAHLGRPRQEQAQQLREQRRRSEERAAGFAGARNGRAGLASGDELVPRIDEAVTRLDALGPVRDAVAARAVDRAGAADAYTGAVPTAVAARTAAAGPDAATDPTPAGPVTDAARLVGGAATGARAGNGPENGDGQAT
ncbi:nitrate- and nitrite sensing domain-containing protein [Micromonospora sp. NPDC050200]|uniref:nitrate- and nitrite sensing domain-containing protein n=1 Tax=Micromonospora sp. NPDC050200 TaxID=3155664 RepID=UPI0033FCD7FC